MFAKSPSVSCLHHLVHVHFPILNFLASFFAHIGATLFSLTRLSHQCFIPVHLYRLFIVWRTPVELKGWRVQIQPKAQMSMLETEGRQTKTEPWRQGTPAEPEGLTNPHLVRGQFVILNYFVSIFGLHISEIVLPLMLVINVLYLRIHIFSYYGGPQWSQRDGEFRHSQRPKSSCWSQGDNRPRWSHRDKEPQQSQRDWGTIFYIWIICASYLHIRYISFHCLFSSRLCEFSYFEFFCIIFSSHCSRCHVWVICDLFLGIRAISSY